MIGQTLSHYKILEKLGQGGMGVVYKAEDSRLDRIVALKFPHLDSELDKGSHSRFKREAKAAAALDHSSICHVFEFDEVDGRPFLVMPFIEGQNLRARINEGPLPLAEALLVAIHVAEGLQEAHAHQVVHRDIKSSNIIITTTGQAKILDFGLAKMKGATRLTGTGKTLGTVSCMSPEQTRGEQLDHRTDIWSLGVVLYEMLTCQLPFQGDYEQAIVYAILNHQPTLASSQRAEIPAEIDWILDKAMAKSKHDRYEDAADLLKDLRAARMKLSTGSGPDIPTWIVKSRKGFLFTAVALVAVTTIVVMASLGIPPFTEWEEGLIPWLKGDAVPQGVTRRITAGPGWSGQPAIAPGGTRIAFVSEDSGNRDIYVIDAQGGVPLQLTTDPAKDENPAWLPDGHAIVFTSHRGGAPAIWRVGQLGGGATLLIPNANDPAVSPDGQRIAFARVDDAGNESLWCAELSDLSTERQLTTAEDGLWWQSDPEWSADGSELCYATRGANRFPRQRVVIEG